jgi:hypothetical protein
MDGEVHPGNVYNIRPAIGGLFPARGEDVLWNIAINEDVKVCLVFFGEFFYPEVAEARITMTRKQEAKVIEGFSNWFRVIYVLCEGEEADNAVRTGNGGVRLNSAGSITNFIPDLIGLDLATVGAVIAVTGDGNDSRLVSVGAPEKSYRMRTFFRFSAFMCLFKKFYTVKMSRPAGRT